MNASPEDQLVLLSIADLDRRAVQAESRRTSPPQAERIRELTAQRQVQLGERAALNGALEDARTELRRLESDVALVEQRRTRDAELLLTSTRAKDAQAIEHELESLAQRQNALEDQELEVMARVEDAEALVVGQQALIESTNAEGATLSAAAKQEVASAAAELQTIATDRAAFVGTIPAELIADYNRRAQRSAGAALLRRLTCEGCRMMLSTTDISRIRQAAPDLIVYCPECTCILVRTDESGL